MTARTLTWLLLAASVAHADGGTVRVQQEAGPFRIAVFSAPEPLRAGNADLSVLVQRREDDAPVLGAEVALRLDGPPPAPPIEARATHDAASNKLLYAAIVAIPAPGVWTLRATVREGTDTADVAGEIAVAPRAPRFETLWPYLAGPPVVVLLFAAREWLRRRREPPDLLDHLR
jgi:hypothetical protein